MSSQRIIFIEDGDRSCLTGTFIPIAHTRFDPQLGEYVDRDDLEAPANSLRSLRISLDRIRSVAGPSFPQFDEVRSWTPINTLQPIMVDYFAFGPTEDCAILIRICPESGTVETMDAKLWVNGETEFSRVVELFQRVSTLWEFLFETMDGQQLVIGDMESWAVCLSKVVVRLVP
ncbi:MAG: hypothetical protein O3A00_22025 [Planctomycetota bacterium]|nr:hypothetical protein [Planctomycetota bacterium]